MASKKAPRLPALSEAEWKVMKCLWDRHPASTRDVLEVVHAETGWAYTTVKTMLARLVEKGAVKARTRANTSMYEPLVARDEARRSAVRALLDRAFDGVSGSLVHFMIDDQTLSKKDRAELAQMLREIDDEGPRA